MRSKDEDVPNHEQNGGRQYLADEVRAQGDRIDKVADKVADIDKRVEGQTVALSTLIEDAHRARQHRDKIWDAINAMRSENQSLAITNSGMPSAVERLASAVEKQGSKLVEIEAERNQQKGAWHLATTSARIAWGIVGGIVLAIAGFIAYIFKAFSSMPPKVPLPPLFIFLVIATAAHAQHNHAQHHANYKSWINKNDKGCCDNQDCGELAEENERQTAAGIEVRIEGEWCPVQSFHYLKRGNAPDWSTAHVCVQKQYAGMPAVGACARLLCYQPKPGI